ncbi:MAG: GyrI-like domain-containing protein [Planctomycetota bacterium]
MNHSGSSLVLLVLVSSCATGDVDPAADLGARAPSILQEPDLALTMPPYSEVHANWKQRLDQPYVYVDWVGSYTGIGEALGKADQAVRAQHIEPSGPPFALYYDDPGTVATNALRARACFPVDSVVTPAAGLQYDVLESTTVVYAFVVGPYPEVPRAYPGLFEYMRSLSWSEAGPIRETYLVDPGGVSDWNQLVTEVQIPASMR